MRGRAAASAQLVANPSGHAVLAAQCVDDHLACHIEDILADRGTNSTERRECAGKAFTENVFANFKTSRDDVLTRAALTPDVTELGAWIAAGAAEEQTRASAFRSDFVQNIRAHGPCAKYALRMDRGVQAGRASSRELLCAELKRGGRYFLTSSEDGELFLAPFTSVTAIVCKDLLLALGRKLFGSGKTKEHEEKKAHFLFVGSEQPHKNSFSIR